MKKIILLITGLIVHSILYAQVHEIQLEIEHRRSVSDVLKSIENRIDKSNSNFKRNEMQDMYSARSAIMEKSLKAIEYLNERLEQKEMLNMVRAEKYLEILKAEIPKEYNAHRLELIQAAIKARNEYLGDIDLYWFSDIAIEDYMYTAYEKRIQLIKKRESEREREKTIIQSKGEKIAEQAKKGEFSNELKIICESLIPTLYRLQTMDIPYYCYDILLSLSLKGYVKGTNNLVNIKQNQSIRGTNKDFPNSPAEYANIDDFIMDYYELYVTGGKSVNESTFEIIELRKIVRECYSKDIVSTLTALKQYK